MEKNAAIDKVLARVGSIIETLPSWDDGKAEVREHLVYLWEESEQQLGVRGVETMMDKLAEGWKEDEEFKSIALGLLTEEMTVEVEKDIFDRIFVAIGQWAENYFGEWQGKEIMTEAEVDVRARYAENALKVKNALEGEK